MSEDHDRSLLVTGDEEDAAPREDSGDADHEPKSPKSPQQSIQVENDDGNDEDVPPQQPSEDFHRLKTIPMASLGIAINLVMILLVFLVPILCYDHGRADDDSGHDEANGDKDVTCIAEPFSVLVYTHAFHWVVHLIVDQYLKLQHKKSRLNGYIEFYLKTKNIRRTPFYLVSVGNAVLLVTVTALSDCVGPSCNDKYTKVDYLRGLMTLECLTNCCLWVNYIINVREFHAAGGPPDVLREDARRRLMLTPPKDEDEGDDESSSPTHYSGERRTRSQIRDDVLEKQAELLRYLHSHVEKLNAKIVELGDQLDEARVDDIL